MSLWGIERESEQFHLQAAEIRLNFVDLHQAGHKIFQLRINWAPPEDSENLHPVTNLLGTGLPLPLPSFIHHNFTTHSHSCWPRYSSVLTFIYGNYRNPECKPEESWNLTHCKSHGEPLCRYGQELPLPFYTLFPFQLHSCTGIKKRRHVAEVFISVHDHLKLELTHK